MKTDKFRHNCRICYKIVGKENVFSFFFNFKNLFFLSICSSQNMVKGKL